MTNIKFPNLVHFNGLNVTWENILPHNVGRADNAYHQSYNGRMPRKIRDYKAELIALGFAKQPRRGKGSHRVWKHPRLRNRIVIAFKDGEDVPPSLEQQLKKARRQLESDS